jgi:hypothetical protein
MTGRAATGADLQTGGPFTRKNGKQVELPVNSVREPGVVAGAVSARSRACFGKPIFRICPLRVAAKSILRDHRVLVFNVHTNRAHSEQMLAKCPACGSLNVRRSSIRPAEKTAAPRLRSPYRCRECGERFWVISKRANYLAGLAGVVIVAGAFAWNVVGVPDDPRREQTRANATAELADLMKRAHADDPVAEYKLSRMYARGNGVETDKKKAQMWLERAAQHGNSDAQYELGNALREGFGVVQDYERAVKWLQQAAMSGHADAQYSLAQMYRSGMGVPTDNAKAYVWFNLAAAHDVAGAAAQRDAVLRVLSPDEILEAQTEARRLSQATGKQSPVAR